ncbi:hypothetical protein CN450_15975, partial [Bacillus cereus]
NWGAVQWRSFSLALLKVNVDICSNETTKHNIEEFLLSSFVYEMIDTYGSLRLACNCSFLYTKK